jgi:hypothetical protein
MKLARDEILLRESRGNFRDNNLDPFGWIGGRWFLTNHRLHFKSNVFNTQKREKSIPLENIASIEKRHGDFVSSKLVIFSYNDSSVELNVPNRKDWIDDIGKAMKELNKYRETNWDIVDIINTQKLEKPSGWLLKVVIQFIIFAIGISILTFFFLNVIVGRH